jgi:sugar lactone lactonase YvrE
VAASASFGIVVRRLAQLSLALALLATGCGADSSDSQPVRPPDIRLRSVLGLALHPELGLLIADGDAHRVLRADLSTGRLAVVADEGLQAPTGIAVGPGGTTYVADRHAGAVFRIANRRATRVSSYGEPLHVAVDSRGDLFVTGRENTVVRVDPATGAARPYAGTGEAGSSGDGGPALAAALTTPHGIAVDPADNVVVADVATVRRIDRATGVIDTIAGSGERRHCGDARPVRETCLTALRVAFAPDGDFYIADPENKRLWRVSEGAAHGIDLGFPPLDVVVESARTLLVADNLNRRVVRYDLRTEATTTVVD